MEFEWDINKARSNRIKHGVDFELAPAFDFDNAKIEVDDSEDCGEERLVATGIIGQSVYVMVYVERGDVIRLISLRKAEKHERKSYFGTI